MAEAKSRKFHYKTTVEWKGEKKGILGCLDKPSFEVATPPEFRGHAGIWSPEDLFIAAINSCVMTTFLFFAEKETVELCAYKSEAEGMLEKIKDKFMFSQIHLKVGIKVKLQEQLGKVQELLDRAEKQCLISNSILPNVKVDSEITKEEQNG